eukprot:1999496-Amphidinium_carterae.1
MGSWSTARVATRCHALRRHLQACGMPEKRQSSGIDTCAIRTCPRKFWGCELRDRKPGKQEAVQIEARQLNSLSKSPTLEQCWKQLLGSLPRFYGLVSFLQLTRLHSHRGTAPQSVRSSRRQSKESHFVGDVAIQKGEHSTAGKGQLLVWCVCPGSSTALAS